MRTFVTLCAAAAALTGCATPRQAAPVAACPVYVTAETPPAPIYPEDAANEGISDTCESRFDIDWQGRPFNLDVRCTYRVFADSAEEALRAATFDPDVLEPSQLGFQCASYPFAYEVSN